MPDEKLIPYGTKVKVYAVTGTVGDPDDPITGQPQKGHRPPYDGIWVVFDPEWVNQEPMYELRNDGPAVAHPPAHGSWYRRDDPKVVPR